MRVADLAGHKDVKTYLSQVPPRCPKTLPLILSQWTDFFVNMADGLTRFELLLLGIFSFPFFSFPFLSFPFLPVPFHGTPLKR